MSAKAAIPDDLDAYGELGIEPGADETAIRRAFRQTALKYHPDKNPSEEAKIKFHQLNLILEVLTDPVQRNVYDQTLRTRQLKRQRDEQLSDDRRRLQRDLERREHEADDQLRARDQSNRRLEMLKMEGLRLRQELGSRNSSVRHVDTGFEASRAVMVTWAPKLVDKLDSNSIRSVMARFGHVVRVVKGPVVALVLYGDQQSAKRALEYAYETDSSRLYNSIQCVTMSSWDDYKDLTLERLRMSRTI